MKRWPFWLPRQTPLHAQTIPGHPIFSHRSLFLCHPHFSLIFSLSLFTGSFSTATKKIIMSPQAWKKVHVVHSNPLDIVFYLSFHSWLKTQKGPSKSGVSNSFPCTLFQTLYSGFQFHCSAETALCKVTNNLPIATSHIFFLYLHPFWPLCSPWHNHLLFLGTVSCLSFGDNTFSWFSPICPSFFPFTQSLLSNVFLLTTTPLNLPSPSISRSSLLLPCRVRQISMHNWHRILLYITLSLSQFQ